MDRSGLTGRDNFQHGHDGGLLGLELHTPDAHI